jgi:hypothetical protein
MAEHANFHYVPEVLAIQHRQPESKTVRDWQKVYREREKIFSPFYHLVDGGERPRLLREKSRAMADRYLGEAFAAASSKPRVALALLLASWGESPLSALRLGWLGVLRRTVCGKIGRNKNHRDLSQPKSGLNKRRPVA